MAENIEDLLKVLISLTGRGVFDEKKLMGLICPSAKGREKLIQAYNLCDGSTKQGEIAKKLKLDPGQFSRTVARWIQSGVVFRVGKGSDSKLLHVYPVEAPGKKGSDAVVI